MRQPAFRQLSPTLNRFAQEMVFAEAIRSSLAPDILPDRKAFPRRFRDEDIKDNRYHGDRVAVDPLLKTYGDAKDKYEQLIQDFFWRGIDRGPGAHEPELFVTGPVGCGKSTFIDYYLRHYCPFKGKHPEEFEKKLVVYYDVRSEEYHKRVNENFYRGLEQAVQLQCKEHQIPLKLSPTGGGVRRADEAIEQLTNFCKHSEYFKYL